MYIFGTFEKVDVMTSLTSSIPLTLHQYRKMPEFCTPEESYYLRHKISSCLKAISPNKLEITLTELPRPVRVELHVINEAPVAQLRDLSLPYLPLPIFRDAIPEWIAVVCVDDFATIVVPITAEAKHLRRILCVEYQDESPQHSGKYHMAFINQPPWKPPLNPTGDLPSVTSAASQLRVA